jgi:indolepyruvate ferredoxin oxidoreductase beta subunit
LTQHGAFLKDGGWVIANGQNEAKNDTIMPMDAIDADKLARKIENPKAVNLIVLGFALAMAEKKSKNRNTLFCSLAEIKDVLESRFGKNQKMLRASLKALEAGYNAKDK